MIYKCKECGKEFKEPRTEKEVIGVSEKIVFINYEYCPYCDSSDIEKIEVKENE